MKAKKQRKPSREGVKTLFGVYLGIFDVSVNIVVGSREAGTRWIRWLIHDPTAEEIPETLRGRCSIREGYCPVVWIPAVPKTSRDIAVLAHELFHATAFVMRWAAIPLIEDTEEIFAHTLGYLMTRALEELGVGRKEGGR